MPGYGMLGHIGLGYETTFANTVARSDFIEGFSESITPNIERFETRNIVGHLYQPDDEAGIESHEGEIVFAGHPESIGFALAGVLGVSSTTVVASGVLYESVITAASSDHDTSRPVPSYSLEVFRDVGSAHLYRGAMFSSVQLNIQPNQDLRVTGNIMAPHGDTIEASTPTFPNTPRSPFTFDTCSITWGGGASAIFEDLTIEIDNQLEGSPRLNASKKFSKYRRTGFRTIGISGTVEFENVTEYNRFLAQSETQLKVYMTKAASHSILIDLPRVVLTSFEATAGGAERITGSFEGVARFDTTSSYEIEVKLTNTRSGYLL